MVRVTYLSVLRLVHRLRQRIRHAGCMTVATCSLGSYILNELLADPFVETAYCLCGALACGGFTGGSVESR